MSRAPLDTQDFRSNFSQCATFIYEYGPPWYIEEPDKEQLYNLLSRGEIAPPIHGANLAPFTAALQQIIYGQRKRIVLEQSPVNYEPNYSQARSKLRMGDIDAAIVLYRTETLKLANSIVKRDQALVDKIVTPILETNGVVFGIRGLVHFPHMDNLLRKRGVSSISLKYPMPFAASILEERIVGAMTLGQVNDLEILKRLYVDVSSCNKIDTIDAMSEKNLRRETLRLVGH